MQAKTTLPVLALALVGPTPTLAQKAPDFGRDIQPILSEKCIACHGPDVQKAGLRLDESKQAIEDGIIKPGDADGSPLIERLVTTDPDDRMPPKGDPLTPAEIALLKDWVSAGAPYQIHWAFRPPERPIPPPVRSRSWPRNEVDRFVLARLDQEGLSPSPEADRYTLIRRVSLDLVGLPPTIDEVDAFVRDRSPDAYDKVIDRLLASPHFGERWARPWLDLARYADSNGFQHDDLREVWPYRDWVVDALNRDLPYDQFTIAQVAGDLLPGADQGTRIATGFFRQGPANCSGDIPIAEVRASLLVDRVNTTGTTWLGLTLECAQCHTHKYDPITQKDYYKILAYFDRGQAEVFHTPEGHRRYEGPMVTLPVAEALRDRVDALERRYAEVTAILARQDPNDPNRPLKDEARKIRRELVRLRPRSLAMGDAEVTPPTHVYVRGNYQQPGEAVAPGVIAALHPLPEDAPTNRLGLARWLVDRRNPLTARVAVNRWWAELFGSGFVETPEDLGLRSERPSHPQLLDWLAALLMDRGWSMKHVLRTIVTSATYRQSSRLTPALLARDPQNRLLARGPRHRLDAEAIRDNALAASGLLSRTLGGPPVHPPQPAGLWESIFMTEDPVYPTSKGEDRYRRGLYTIVRRAAPNPTMAALDAPARGSCVARRPRTNTPLQALTLLNDPVFVEASAGLAARTAARAGNDSDRLTFAFRSVLARPPRPAERRRLLRLHARMVRHYRADAVAAERLVPPALANGARPPAVLAAWFVVGQVLLNLDETVTKP